MGYRSRSAEAVFAAIADDTRRTIVQRVARRRLTAGGAARGVVPSPPPGLLDRARPPPGRAAQPRLRCAHRSRTTPRLVGKSNQLSFDALGARPARRRQVAVALAWAGRRVIRVRRRDSRARPAARARLLVVGRALPRPPAL